MDANDIEQSHRSEERTAPTQLQDLRRTPVAPLLIPEMLQQPACCVRNAASANSVMRPIVRIIRRPVQNVDRAYERVRTLPETCRQALPRRGRGGGGDGIILFVFLFVVWYDRRLLVRLTRLALEA